ncbi:MAG: hypothetical protein ACM3TR_15045 [Caulobacteraceae bacterium]
MGCGGGHRDFFRLIDNYGCYGRGCGGNNYPQEDYYQQDDIQVKLIIIKNMYAENLMNDEEYQTYKQRIYDRSISFDELIAIKRNKLSEDNRIAKHSENKPDSEGSPNEYKAKLKKLDEAKKKIIQVQEKLLLSIKELENEKVRMEELAETMLKSSDEAAEKYINKKIDLEENIQNLVRRNKELEAQAEEIDRMVKNLEVKELELEAARLQEELTNIRLEA